MSSAEEPDHLSSSKQRRARAKAVKARLWATTQKQVQSMPSSFEHMLPPHPPAPSHHVSNPGVHVSNPGSDYDLPWDTSLIDERLDKMQLQLREDLKDSVADATTKLAHFINERFTAIEVDMSNVKVKVESLEPQFSHNVEKKICDIEGGVAACTKQILYLETLLGESARLRSSTGWRSGDRIRLNGMKSATRNGKDGVIHSDQAPQIDRVAVVLDDEMEPISFPSECVALLPWKSLLYSVDDRLDCLAKIVAEGLGDRGHKADGS